MNVIKKMIYSMVFFLILLLFPLRVFAENETSLTIQYEAGMTGFSLYQIAGFSETGVFTLVPSYEKYLGEVSLLGELEQLDASAWRVLAATLEAVVIRDDIRADYFVKTDEQGQAVLNGLEKGLYLMLGDPSEDEEYMYTPSALLVSVPNKDVSGDWNHHVQVIHNKLTKESITDTVSRTVLKIWQDEGKEQSRPKEIVIQLYRNTEMYDEVILSEKNNWQYQWMELESGYKWIVTEKSVPAHYKVQIEMDQDTFVVTNVYDEQDESEEKDDQDKELPQTGQLLWPVPLLAVTGVLSLVVGFSRRKGGT